MSRANISDGKLCTKFVRIILLHWNILTYRAGQEIVCSV